MHTARATSANNLLPRLRIIIISFRDTALMSRIEENSSNGMRNEDPRPTWNSKTSPAFLDAQSPKWRYTAQPEKLRRNNRIESYLKLLRTPCRAEVRGVLFSRCLFQEGEE